MSDSAACVGAQELQHLIHSLYPAESTIVGVCGYPNTGKSSVINGLAKRPACQSAPVPGCTREIRTIYVSSRLKLLDSPGVISDTRNNVVLREELLENPIGEVGRLFDMVHDIHGVYEIYELQFQPAQTLEEQVRHFLFALGNKLGRIKQGGVVDIEEVAIGVIRDWNRGVIPFWKELRDCKSIQQVQQAAIQGIDGDMLSQFNANVLGHLVSRNGLRLK